jgi:cytochrome P450
VIAAVRAGREFRRDPLRFMLALDGDSDAVRFRAGFTDFTLLRNPETIHRVLVADNDLYGEGKWTRRGMRVMHECLITLEGRPHRERRLLLQPAFDRAAMTDGGPAMVQAASRVSARWRDGDTVEIRGEMSRLALAVVAEVLLDLDLEPDADRQVEALLAMLYAISRGPLSWGAARRLARVRKLLDRTAARALAKPEGRLQSALSASSSLSEHSLEHEIVSMLIAGVDTTPGTLAWTWFVLGRHPEAEAKVHEELDAVLAGRPPTAADIPRLPYLRLVLDEVLRLYPPVHFIDRRPLVDVELDRRRVAAGSYILLSPLLTHRDARFFEEPTAFRPERWANGHTTATRAYFPFGAGPHTCIGIALARTELVLAVATLASRWRLRPAEGFPEDPSPQTSRFPMTVEGR